MVLVAVDGIIAAIVEAREGLTVTQVIETLVLFDSIMANNTTNILCFKPIFLYGGFFVYIEIFSFPCILTSVRHTVHLNLRAALGTRNLTAPILHFIKLSRYRMKQW